MIINFDNIGNTGGGGGGYVLPVATANRLGGVKVGSGLTIDAAGVLSTSGGTAPSGDSVKVYMYDELYSGDTYDHYDLSIPQEMLSLAKSGTPVYVLYRGQNKSVYMALTTSIGENTLVFYGADGTQHYSCTLVTTDHWILSSITHSRNGDYEVVLQLPQRAEEGQLFFVPAHTENVLYRTYVFDCSAMYQRAEGGLVLGGNVDDKPLNGKSLYFEPNDGEGDGWFHWDWGENEHDWIEKEGWGWYKVGEGDYTFYAKVPDGSVDLSIVNEYVTVDSSVTETVQISVAPATYRYTGNAFRKEVIKIKMNDFKGADYGFNSDNLFDYLQQFTEEELKQNFVFEYDGNYANYVAYSESSEPEYSNYTFEVKVSSVVYPIGTPTVSPIYSLNVYPDGHIGSDGQNEISIFLPIRMSVNVVDSGLTCQNSGALWVRATDRTWGGNPFVVVIYDSETGNVLGYTQNCWFRQAYDGDNSDWADLSSDGTKIFGCEWYQYGDKITAEWAVSSEGNVIGGAPINWTVTSNVHSAADSTIPTNS